MPKMLTIGVAGEGTLLSKNFWKISGRIFLSKSWVAASWRARTYFERSDPNASRSCGWISAEKDPGGPANMAVKSGATRRTLGNLEKAPQPDRKRPRALLTKEVHQSIL